VNQLRTGCAGSPDYPHRLSFCALANTPKPLNLFNKNANRWELTFADWRNRFCNSHYSTQEGMMRKTAYLLGAATLGLSLSLLGGCHANRRERVVAKDKAAEVKDKAAEVKDKAATASTDELDFAVKQEIRQSYKLAPGATVDASGFNGLLEVETSDTDTAEIYIVRSARNEADFDERKVILQQEGNRLIVRIRNNRERSFWAMLGGRHEERQRAYLKLPRQLDLNVSGVNGKTSIGEVGGRVELSGLNGPVTVARATGAAEISGINGKVDVTLAQLAKGVEVHGINGNIDLRFAGEVNADVEVRGVNGNINPELPNVTVKQQKRGRLEARVGKGGSAIEVNGVNGNINLLPANAQATKTGGSGVTAAK
jgi:hypothetical protein